MDESENKVNTAKNVGEENKTDLWLQSNPSTIYNLPETCPKCGAHLKSTNVYVGIFPYIHVDFTLVCWANPDHKYNFCMPYNKVMASGYTTFDTKENRRFYTEKQKCPFHGIPLTPVRLYGDLVFNDGTRKIQLRCSICNYSERVVLKS